MLKIDVKNKGSFTCYIKTISRELKGKNMKIPIRDKEPLCIPLGYEPITIAITFSSSSDDIEFLKSINSDDLLTVLDSDVPELEVDSIWYADNLSYTRESGYKSKYDVELKMVQGWTY